MAQPILPTCLYRTARSPHSLSKSVNSVKPRRGMTARVSGALFQVARGALIVVTGRTACGIRMQLCARGEQVLAYTRGDSCAAGHPRSHGSTPCAGDACAVCRSFRMVVFPDYSEHPVFSSHASSVAVDEVLEPRLDGSRCVHCSIAAAWK